MSLNYLRSAALSLAVLGASAQTAFSASQSDISALIRKFETQAKAKTTRVAGSRVTTYDAVLEHPDGQRGLHDKMEVAYVTSDNGGKQIVVKLWDYEAAPNDVFLHVIYDGGATPPDGNPDNVLKLTGADAARMVDQVLGGSLESMKKDDKFWDSFDDMAGRLTHPDAESRRFYDVMVDQALRKWSFTSLGF